MDNFEQIVSEYEDRLCGFAQRMMSNREDAEEVVQDAFVRAHRALNAMTPDERECIRLKPWLFVITLNVARNRLRKKSLPSVSLETIQNPDRIFSGCHQHELPESMLERSASIEVVEQALHHLPPGLRDTARLRFIEGRTHIEIATIFKQPVGTIKSRVHRATRIMRESFKYEY